jgi:AcrR family transcriptional regulator
MSVGVIDFSTLMSPGVINYAVRDMSRWKPDAAGRLMTAAIALFDEHGYDQTTVAEIAERAGLTKRTFFRYFADKREVLFGGSEELRHRWLEAVAAAPAGADPLTAATAGFDPVAAMFAERHEFARIRARIVAANPELQERELIKLQSLAGSIETALVERGTPAVAAILAAQAALTVFHVAFARWADQDDPAGFRQLMDVSLDELRSVTAAQPRTGAVG